jgi:hypothetical protein
MTVPGIPVVLIYNDCSSTNIVSASYTQLTSSLAAECGWAQISNSSTSTIKLAVGPSGSEGDIIEIPASCVMPIIPLTISKGARITAKSLKTATISSGELLINFFR